MNSDNLVKLPSICFITMCKNEEHCIKTTLESVLSQLELHKHQVLSVCTSHLALVRS